MLCAEFCGACLSVFRQRGRLDLHRIAAIAGAMAARLRPSRQPDWEVRPPLADPSWPLLPELPLYFRCINSENALIATRPKLLLMPSSGLFFDRRSTILNGAGPFRRNFVTNNLLEVIGCETGRDKGMLTPEDAVSLTLMRYRRVELKTLRNEADTRDRAEELQAQLDELDADYDHVLQAAVLI
jgi:hypothetical protein